MHFLNWIKKQNIVTGIEIENSTELLAKKI